ALLRGEPVASIPTLVRVHVHNPLADALHWRRPDFGPAVGDVLATIAAEERGALVLLGDTVTPDALLRRIQSPLPHEAADAVAVEPGGAREQALGEWRRNGAGGQILADLGLGKLRVL